MPFTLNGILHCFDLVANPNVRCPLCGERQRLWKNGFYQRYRFAENKREDIQRYRCRNPACPRASFSILPHPFLPWLRVSLCFLAHLHGLWLTGRHTIAELARQLGQGWSVMRRRVRRAAWLAAWLERERALALAGLDPCVNPGHDWTLLCQTLSHAWQPIAGGP